LILLFFKKNSRKIIKNLRTFPTTIIDQKIGTGFGKRLKRHYKPECVFSQITKIPEMLARIGKQRLLIV
jgi:hypothetical protein